MKVGNLVWVNYRCFDLSLDGVPGIITWVFSDGTVDVLYPDGEYTMDPDDLEVINESR